MKLGIFISTFAICPVFLNYFKHAENSLIEVSLLTVSFIRKELNVTGGRESEEGQARRPGFTN